MALNARIGADFTEFDRAIGGAAGTVKKLAGDLGLAFSAAALVAGMKAFIGDIMRTADELVRVSDRTGETIEAVQRLGFVATQSGNNLDEIASAIGQMQNKLASGDASAIASVQRLGVSFADMEAASPEAAVRLIGTALQGVTNANERAAIATDLFGKAGRAVLPTLLADYDALAAAAGIMSEETVRKLDDIGDAWDRLKGHTTAAGGEFLVNIVSAFENPVEFIDAWMQTGNVSMALAGTGMAASFRDAMKRELAKPLPVPVWKEITTASGVKVWVWDTTELDKYTAKVRQVPGALKPIGLAQQDIAKIVAESNAAIRKSWDETQKAIAEAAQKHAASVSKFWDEIDKLTANAGKMMADWNGEILEKNKATAKFWVDDWLQAQKDLAGLMRDSGKMMADWNDEILAKNKAGVDAWAQDWLKGEKKKDADFKKALNTAADTFADLSRVAEMSSHKTTAAIMTIASSAVKAFASGGPWAAAWATAMGVVTAFADKIFKTEGRKVNDLRDAFISAAGGLGALGEKARQAGMTLDALLRASTVKDYEAAVAALNGRFQTQVDLTAKLATTQQALDAARASSMPTWDALSGIADKYSISIEKAGRGVQQLMINANATTLLNDWQTWAKAGGDLDVFAKASAQSFSTLVSQARTFGTTLPENMKTVLQSLVDQGKLLDASGKVIGDLSGLTFGAGIQTETEKMAAAIDDLVLTLQDLTTQLAILSGAPPVVVAATGAGAGMAGRGSQVAFSRAGAGEAVSGGGGGGGTVIIQLDGRQLAEIVVPEIPGVVERYGLGG